MSEEFPEPCRPHSGCVTAGHYELTGDGAVLNHDPMDRPLLAKAAVQSSSIVPQGLIDEFLS